MVSRGGWNTVKQQKERADTVGKTAAKENEASVLCSEQGASENVLLINVGCFMVCSDTHIHDVKHFMHREPVGRQRGMQKYNSQGL